MDYMPHAISLARLALGNVSPNPAVGAVIVKDGMVFGQGFTQIPGGNHAEIVALKEAGERARGATLYVTLEPCSHQGRTPPCIKAIIEAGIVEVHAAMIDPNPLVNGRGKDELEKAGIKVVLGEHEEEAREVIEAYIKYITTGIPFVTAKFAMSLDGKIATRTGDSKWISGEESRRHAHYLRFINDAIMVGVKTVLIDDPRLTSRFASRGGQVVERPLRVVLDSTGRTPETARIFHEPGNVFMAVGENINPKQKKAYRRAGAEVVELPTKRGLIDLESLLRALGKKEVTSILVEGGAKLLGSLFDARLVDKVNAFISPIIVGGHEATTAVGGRGVESLSDSIGLERVKTRFFARDIMISGYVGDKNCSPVSSKS